MNDFVENVISALSERDQDVVRDIDRQLEDMRRAYYHAMPLIRDAYVILEIVAVQYRSDDAMAHCALCGGVSPKYGSAENVVHSDICTIARLKLFERDPFGFKDAYRGKR